MEKWKKKIFKAIYKQWMSKQKVSYNDIMAYLSNPENEMEIRQNVLKLFYFDYKLRIRARLYSLFKREDASDYRFDEGDEK